MSKPMSVADALVWADNWGPLQSEPPDGDAPALMALAAEVRLLTEEAALWEERARHLGWRDEPTCSQAKPRALL